MHNAGTGMAPAQQGAEPKSGQVDLRQPKWEYRLEEIRAAIRDASSDPYRKIAYTRTAVVLGFAAGFLLSRRLWVSSRYYPLIPVWHGLPHITFPLDYILFASLLLLLVVAGVAARPRVPILSFAALLFFLALFDQTRWQPWVYLYVFILLAMACFSWRAEDIRGRENVLNICRLIVGSTYCYSGLQKLNPRFAAGVSSLLGPVAHRMAMFHAAGWILGSIETGIGIGLLTRKYRDVAVVCGILMHLFILYNCIVLYHWNSVVWPWNMAMIALLPLLFWRTGASFSEIVWRNSLRFQKLVLVLFGVMPFLSFFGWWDSYLSASLYSANVPDARVYMGTNVRRELPLGIQRYIQPMPGAMNVLKIQDWSLGELNVPPYPAARAYRLVGAELCKYSHNSPDLELLTREKDTLLRKGVVSRDSCLGTLVVDKW